MYGVNCSIPKTLVKYLIKYTADYTDNDILREVLLDVLDTPVSPELLPPDENGNIAQITEDVVGPYELHDFFLYNMMRQAFPPEKIYFLAKLAFKDKYDNAVILKWLRNFYWRFFSQQFKRSCIPDGPKVGSVSLSPRGDWRMPSDASVAEFIKRIESLE
jgi:NAD+ synthase (glutamine-hydrolysing)